MSVTTKQLEELKKPLEIKDIDFRIQSINNGGFATILAYKDARVDMNRLDDVLGPSNWERDHKEIKNVVYGGIGINIEELGWVWKWDAGSESNTEKEKGESSDSFKRAGFNWGIGRELYDFPLIQLKLKSNEFTTRSGKNYPTYELNLRKWKWQKEVDEVTGEISKLIAIDTTGAVRFNYPENEKQFNTVASTSNLSKKASAVKKQSESKVEVEKLSWE